VRPVIRQRKGRPTALDGSTRRVIRPLDSGRCHEHPHRRQLAYAPGTARSSGRRGRPYLVDRWAEPLDVAIPFVLGQNLKYLLDPNGIELYPWNGGDRLDYVVKVDILGFNRNPAGEAGLDADWDIEDITGRELHSGHTTLVVPATEHTTKASVHALGVPLSEFSQEIAAVIRELEASQPER